MKKIIGLALSLTAIAVTTNVTAGTLEDVKARGKLNCIVNTGLPGFSSTNDQGQWSGIDVDYCRGVSAAVFGDPDQVEYRPTSAKVRFTTLTSGEGDILSRNTTWTMSRDVDHGNFVGVTYYDGQGFMVKKELGVESALELGGAAICTQTGTTTELNLADYFRTHGMEYTVVAFESQEEVLDAYEAGRCDVYTTDRSGLAADKTKMGTPDDHLILPEIISKEPLGPMVRSDDAAWEDIARWTLGCMLNAEELGVNSGNVEEMKGSDNPNVQRLLGVDGEFGASLGLDNAWCANIISMVGNYAEIYDRNIGPDTPIGLDRGVNALWTNGGIQYAAPIR